MEQYLTVEEYADHLKVSRATIYRQLQEGLPCIRISKRIRRIDPVAADSWLAEKSAVVKPAETPKPTIRKSRAKRPESVAA